MRVAAAASANALTRPTITRQQRAQGIPTHSATADSLWVVEDRGVLDTFVGGAGVGWGRASQAMGVVVRSVGFGGAAIGLGGNPRGFWLWPLCVFGGCTLQIQTNGDPRVADPECSRPGRFQTCGRSRRIEPATRDGECCAIFGSRDAYPRHDERTPSAPGPATCMNLSFEIGEELAVGGVTSSTSVFTRLTARLGLGPIFGHEAIGGASRGGQLEFHP